MNSCQILHFGDNEQADIFGGRAAGLDTIYIKSIVAQSLDVPSFYFQRYLMKTAKLQNSILLSLFARRFVGKWPSPLEAFGYLVGGALAISYCQFINKNVSKYNIDRVLFLSRDGYVLKKVFDILFNVKSTYVYASRKVVLHCVDFHEIPEYENEAKNIFYKECETEFDTDKYNDWIINNYREYMEYFNSLNIVEKRLATVDLTTALFTGSKLIEKMVGGDLVVRLCTKCLKFFDKPNLQLIEKEQPIYVYQIIEELFSAPEPTCDRIDDGQPMFSNENIIEHERIERFRDIEKGIVAFVTDANEWFSVIPKFDCEECLKNIEIIARSNAYSSNAILNSLVHQSSIDGQYLTLLNLINRSYETGVSVKDYSETNNKCCSNKNYNRKFIRISFAKYIRYKILHIIGIGHYSQKLEDYIRTVNFARNNGYVLFDTTKARRYKILSKVSKKYLMKYKQYLSRLSKI